MVQHVPQSASPGSASFRGPLALERFTGDDARPPLLFAHGFGQTRLAWRRAAAQLATKGFHGTAFDARGHGESHWNPPQQAYQLEQFIDDLVGLADAHRRPPVLVGASMGGLLGMFSQGRRDPPPFSALVLVDITPRWEVAGVARILDFMTAHPEGFSELEEAADAIAAYLPHRQQRKSPADLEKLLVRQPDGRWHWHWDPRLIDSIGRSGEDQQEDLLDAARRIQVPTLLVSGGRSELVTQTHVEEFLSLVPHAQHVCLPKATHMVVGDDNDAFTRTIFDFLVALPSGSPDLAGGLS